MMKSEREHVIEWLWTINPGYSRAYFENQTDEELNAEFNKHMVGEETGGGKE